MRERLEALRPDLVLVEGPPELTEILHWVAHRDLRPPVAVLAYDADNPQRAAFYPFAHYSPEWVAVRFAHEYDVPVRAADLPLLHSLAPKPEADEAPVPVLETPPATHPLDELAHLAGYADHHGWWEDHFEQRFVLGESAAHFEAVLLTMQAAREAATTHSPAPPEDMLREAFMRQALRQAESEGFQNVAFVCGAWHAPAVLDLESTKKADEKAVKLKSNLRVRCTWIPWTNERMGWQSGYGAGIASPGWYEHRWEHPDDRGEGWLTNVARLFRTHKTDVSTAHVIESLRLATALAGLRGLPRPGLAELNEATQAVMCLGEAVKMKLVETELTVAHRLGTVPDELPKVPLQADFEATVKKLRLELREDRRPVELDLRRDLDLARSVLFHRLRVLDVAWAEPVQVAGKGTFKEAWNLKWQPDFTLKLIGQAVWGNTLPDAATAFLLDRARQGTALGELARLLDRALPAELFGAIDPLLARIDALAAVGADVPDLIEAVGPLVGVSRYGNVRNTDLNAVRRVVEGLVTRLCAGLPTASHGLDDDGARRLLDGTRRVHEGLRLLDNEELTAYWHRTLRRLADDETGPPLLAGGATRLLFDDRLFDETEAARRLGLALSLAAEPASSAAWVEGFLSGSGLILLYDERLWGLLHGWVAGLSAEVFTTLLPVLRRTFSRFAPAERRQLGEKARLTESGQGARSGSLVEMEFDEQRAELVLGVVGGMLGM